MQLDALTIDLCARLWLRISIEYAARLEAIVFGRKKEVQIVFDNKRMQSTGEPFGGGRVWPVEVEASGRAREAKTKMCLLGLD